MYLNTIFIHKLDKIQMFLPNPFIISEVFLAVPAVNLICMVTHKGSLLELGTQRAGEQHPPGHGGAHAQQVGVAGGGYVSIIAWHLPRTGGLIAIHILELQFTIIL